MASGCAFQSSTGINTPSHASVLHTSICHHHSIRFQQTEHQRLCISNVFIPPTLFLSQVLARQKQKPSSKAEGASAGSQATAATPYMTMPYMFPPMMWAFPPNGGFMPPFFYPPPGMAAAVAAMMSKSGGECCDGPCQRFVRGDDYRPHAVDDARLE